MGSFSSGQPHDLTVRYRKRTLSTKRVTPSPPQNHVISHDKLTISRSKPLNTTKQPGYPSFQAHPLVWCHRSGKLPLPSDSPATRPHYPPKL
nr:unnamed protein product [Digitaria exilis]